MKFYPILTCYLLTIAGFQNASQEGYFLQISCFFSFLLEECLPIALKIGKQTLVFLLLSGIGIAQVTQNKTNSKKNLCSFLHTFLDAIWIAGDILIHTQKENIYIFDLGCPRSTAGEGLKLKSSFVHAALYCFVSPEGKGLLCMLLGWGGDWSYRQENIELNLLKILITSMGRAGMKWSHEYWAAVVALLPCYDYFNRCGWWTWGRTNPNGNISGRKMSYLPHTFNW